MFLQKHSLSHSCLYVQVDGSESKESNRKNIFPILYTFSVNKQHEENIRSIYALLWAVEHSEIVYTNTSIRWLNAGH